MCDKATERPWVQTYMGNKDGSPVLTREEYMQYCGECYDKTLAHGNENDRVVTVHQVSNEPLICIVGNGPQGLANATLITTAVNRDRFHERLVKVVACMLGECTLCYGEKEEFLVDGLCSSCKEATALLDEIKEEK